MSLSQLVQSGLVITSSFFFRKHYHQPRKNSGSEDNLKKRDREMS